MSRLDKEVAVLATLPAAQLRERWQALTDGTGPLLPEDLMRRLIAQHVQEKRLGRLPNVVARELERRAAGTGVAVRQTLSLTPGTRLVREWNGRTIAVEVLEDGFLWEDRTYRSLSEIACAVTGAHWSGPRFFGLKRRGG